MGRRGGGGIHPVQVMSGQVLSDGEEGRGGVHSVQVMSGQVLSRVERKGGGKGRGWAVYNLRIHLNLSIRTSNPKFNLPE